MRERIYIPRAVMADIEERLTGAINDTVAEFDSAWEDEDVVTGHLGGQMTTRQRSVVVTDDEINGTWKWSLHYRKFRGRGPGATERTLGADGIFEFMLEDSGSYGSGTIKSMLFQSKIAGSDDNLIEQCARLSTWREAAFVILYDVDDFKAVTLDAVFRARGKVDDALNVPLATFLVREFIACNVGDNDLRYIPSKRELSWDTVNGETVGVKFSVPNRFRLKVTPPKRGVRAPYIQRYIEPDKIYRHRMKATADDVLKVQYQSEAQSPKQAAKELFLAYHPDFAVRFSFEAKELMNARMQEFNEARTELESQRIGRHSSSWDQHYDDDKPASDPPEASRRFGNAASDEDPDDPD